MSLDLNWTIKHHKICTNNQTIIKSNQNHQHEIKNVYRWTQIWQTQWDQENWSVICKICHMHMTDSVRHMQVCMLLHWGPHFIYIYIYIYMYLSAKKYQTVRTECCLAERNSANVLVSGGLSWLLDTCLSDMHNANYIVNSFVCAVILVHGNRVTAYRIRPMHGPIHVLDMHGTGTKHIVCHSQKFVVQQSGVAEFTCSSLWKC